MEERNKCSSKLSNLIKANLDFGINLNLGCGFNKLDFFINIDKFPENKPDIIFDLECEEILPFDDNTVGFVYGSHIIEHIKEIDKLMYEIWRVCKKGARCLFITPYLTSDDAFESSGHVRFMNENSWMYFDKQINSHIGYHGVKYDFRVIETVLVPYPEFVNDIDLEFKKKHWRNIIREMRCEMEVIK